MYSLRFKIFSILLITSLSLISLQIYFIAPKIKANHLEDAIELQRSLADQISNDFDFSFRQAITELENIARLPGIKSSNRAENDELITIMDRATTFYNYYFLMDKAGTWLSYPKRPHLVGKSIPEQNMSWVRETIGEQKTAFLNVVQVTQIGKQVSGFSTPVLADSGDPEKLLRGVFVLSEENFLWQTVKRIKVGANGYAFLVAENGLILSHPQLKQTPESFQVYDFNKYPPVREVIKGKAGYSEYEYNDKTWLACYRPIKSTGWGIIVQQPLVDVYAHIEEDISLIFRLFLLTFISYGLILFLGIRHTLNPLAALAHSLKQRTKLDPNIKYAKDEIGELATSFRDMFNETQESLEAKENSETELLAYKESLEDKVIKRTEALQRSRDLLNAAQEIGHVGSWEWEVSTGNLIWSDEVFRIFGHKPQEFKPTFKYFLKTIPRKDRRRLQEALHAAFDDKTPYHVEHSIILPDCGQRIVEENGKVIRDEDGSPVTMRGSIKDVTERKLTEENLEKLVAERTVELEKAKQNSDKANLAKSVFLASMSHELRTPMNSILGFAQLLESDKKDPLNMQQKNHTETILKSGKHLLKLINDVLDLARIESGGIGEISLEPVNLYSLCHETTELVKNLAESMNVELLPCALDKSAFIKADRTRFKQIFLNVLTNAIKYNKPGGQVGFSCEKFDTMTRLFISDTGPGIPKEKIDLLFEPFDRLGAETSSIEGTGIGLTISKRLIELMHGSIGVESELGKGSTFFLDIPSAESPAEHVGSLCKIENKNLFPQGEYTFLYIEDDQLNRDLLAEIIDQFTPEIKLLAADCAADGIDIAIHQKPDLILMDLTLPDIDGFEAFSRLNELQETKSIPVIALSGNAMPANIKKAHDAGFADYLTKPFNIKELYHVIGGVFEGNSQ